MDEKTEGKETSWSYSDESARPDLETKMAPDKSVSWTGSEFISNEKNITWYVSYVIFMVIVCAIVYLFSKDFLSIVFIFVVGVLFVIIASRKPRQLNFSIDRDGIKVGSKTYDYGQFKSFSIQQHGVISYISLLPLHRFQNELSIYYPPEQEDTVLKTLVNQLPHDQRKENLIDKISKLARF